MSTMTPVGGIATQSSTRRVNRVWHWVRQALLGLLALIVSLALVGAIYQTVVEASDMRAYPAPGQLIDVGGHRLHIQCLGSLTATGPTVILEAGLGETSVDWVRVQE